MQMVYGAADGDDAVRMFQEKFPNRYLPGHEIFIANHRCLREYGKFSRRQERERERERERESMPCMITMMKIP